MKYYTNKKTNEVFAYESLEEAKNFTVDFKNLVEMNDEILESYKNPPLGGTWSVKGWSIDEKIANQQLIANRENQIAQYLSQIEPQISHLRDLRDFDEALDSDLIHLKTLVLYKKEILNIDVTDLSVNIPEPPNN